MLLVNLVGMGIGPPMVAGLSDLLQNELGADSLRYAMLMPSNDAVWSGYHFWQVGHSVDRTTPATLHAHRSNK